MYMTFRLMNADIARAADVAAMCVTARDHLNQAHGANFAVSVPVGGDPSAISMSAAWPTMGDYDRVRLAAAGDPAMQSLVRTAGSMLTSVQDTIGQVLRAPGDRGAYAAVSTASMHLPSVAAAIPFAIEVAEYASSKTGREVGVMAAKTGNRSGIMWASFADSLDQVMDDGQMLETDPAWLDFFKRSEGLFADGSLEDTLWQLLP